MDRNDNVINLISDTFTIRRPRVANFADIIKVAITFIKATFKTQIKLKEVEIMN